MSGPLLYLVVAVSGGAVLAVEILGTRILGPFYGVSLYLWSALISITLAALSVGYVLGGRWADRGPRAARLAILLAGAGAWLLLVPWLRDPLLHATEAWGLRTAVLVAATALFFPPLALLGMVGPYAIRLRAGSLGEVGRTAGSVFAISTVASVGAALLTGFWLIPNFGVQRLTVSIGAVLVATALVTLLVTGRGRTRGTGVALLVGLLGLGWVAWAAPGARLAGSVRFHAQSPYGEIRVLEDSEARYLLIDGGVHTAVRLEDGTTLHPYVVVLELAKELFAAPGRLLVVGLGGGALVRSYHADGWRVEAVEIDPAVIRVAREHFGLEPAAVVHAMDGRRFLRATGPQYDLVILDAFGSSTIPFHLVTCEAFAQAASRLAPGGVLALNVEAVGWRHVLVRSLGATLRESFAHVVALPTAEPPDRLGNVILLASNRPLAIEDDALGDPLAALGDPGRHGRVLTRRHAWDNRFVPVAAGAPVLTDDRNPVDLWSEEVNHEARRQLHRFFPARGASW